MALFALLAVQCSSDNRTDDMGANTDEQARTTTGEANGNGQSVNADLDGPNTRTDGVGAVEGNRVDAGNAVAPGTVITPVQERTNATTEMNGLRATLMADLEVVRARLKAGGQKPEEKKADQARAADLAQGLERVDRTLLAMGDATDATWATMRETQLKEVAEVREWMAKYKSDDVTRAMK